MRNFLFILIILISACRPDETISGQTNDQEWVLQSIKGAQIDATITITFTTDGKVTGRAPCNAYFATQTAPLPWFELGPIGATKRACPNLKLESTYFQTLAMANVAEVTSDTLILSKDETALLTFKRP